MKPRAARKSVNTDVQIVLGLPGDLVGLIALAFRPQQGTVAVNLVLRPQLALYKERGIKLRGTDVRNRRSGDKQTLHHLSTPMRCVRSEVVLFSTSSHETSPG